MRITLLIKIRDLDSTNLNIIGFDIILKNCILSLITL